MKGNASRSPHNDWRQGRTVFTMPKRSGFRKWLRLVPRVWRLLKSPHIPLGEKLLFAIPVLLYWVLPDVMPFFPIDDLTVTVLLAAWFANRMEKKYPEA